MTWVRRQAAFSSWVRSSSSPSSSAARARCSTSEAIWADGGGTEVGAGPTHRMGGAVDGVSGACGQAVAHLIQPRRQIGDELLEQAQQGLVIAEHRAELFDPGGIQDGGVVGMVHLDFNRVSY